MKNERLTEKHESESTHVPNYIPKTNTPSKDVYEKLGQIEDLEEILGVGILTLFYALKEGFYVKTEEGSMFCKEDESHTTFVRHLGYDIEICCEECENSINAIPKRYIERSTKDYGKTWALTKEELE